MGMEPVALGAANWQCLWTDPMDYQPLLKAAVDELITHGMNVSIFNHQLCTLDKSLWPFAKNSISDWKAEYLEACQGCSMREDCGGFFTSAKERHSRGIVTLA